MSGPSFVVLALIPGLILRVILIVYSIHHDANSSLKYTDIDYHVFSDAARSILRPKNGTSIIGSPYDRATYRYTPLLALILTPNELFHPCWGKILFSLADLIIGIILYQLSSHRTKSVKYIAALWLLNPFVANISTRGSSEALLGVIVMGSLYFCQTKRYNVAAVFLGLAVHLKLYPVIYGASIWTYLGSYDGSHRHRLRINAAQSRFAIISLVTLFVFNLAMYLIWGKEFIESSYIYHLHRLDHRHNFSPYFYPIYLRFTSPHSDLSGLRKILHDPLISFVPQITLSLGLGLYYGPKDLAFSWFIQTYAFVTFNKVVTSQYFMWFLWFLPLLITKIKLNRSEIFWTLAVGIGSQAIWLSQAYRLEINGESVYTDVWICSLAFLLGNAWIIGRLITGFSRHSTPADQDKNLEKVR